jgi:hypothetical protein
MFRSYVIDVSAIIHTHTHTHTQVKNTRGSGVRNKRKSD